MTARQGVSGAQCRNFAGNYKILFTLFMISAFSFKFEEITQILLIFQLVDIFSRRVKVIFLFPPRFSHSQ
ncbi:hypothetical protein [Klebsiella quasivariicola]|uniref:Uncharacterized protein n=1 Tax=Klebsiella quasivariicola TaxID=2026240 RepID=A0A8B4TWK1_9ENTR|nr:hypothetical protein [Klebsiella quasivariicola]ASV22601.1 hypothetical protein B8P98_26655 [Klebsiella quasivariicola]MBF7822134.1 hypothetical protein [Klebsiella quasivariicola]MCJ1829795.1 hypothetical protein [Klebsiella quasivariicola]SXE00867.1 Uncharacterised protein [Klebsiella quasivariicola]